MTDIQIFTNPEFGEIRTLEINEEPWFVGKDVATALGYRDSADALKRHVDAEDKLTRCFTDSGQKREMYTINESGLYSLILSSKLPSAQRFKRWVTSEVLPSIRKNGGYMQNRRLTEAIEAVNRAKKNLNLARKLHDMSSDAREKSKNALAEIRAIHSKNCDAERKDAQRIRDWQAYLDAQIDHLNYVAFGLPAFEQIMNEALSDMLPAEKEE